MKITPGCTYEIVVEANPNDGKRKASLNYTVPGRWILEVVRYAVKSDVTFRIKIIGQTKVRKTCHLGSLWVQEPKEHVKFLRTWGNTMSKRHMGSGGIFPHIIDLGFGCKRLALRSDHFTPGRKKPTWALTGDWMNTKSGKDLSSKKLLPLTEMQQIRGPPARDTSTKLTGLSCLL